MPSIGFTIRFTLPHLSRNWFIDGWSNRFFDSGFAGIRLLGVDFQVEWSEMPILYKELPEPSKKEDSV